MRQGTPGRKAIGQAATAVVDDACAAKTAAGKAVVGAGNTVVSSHSGGTGIQEVPIPAPPMPMKVQREVWMTFQTTPATTMALPMYSIFALTLAARD
jgi:hypothetical protein